MKRRPFILKIDLVFTLIVIIAFCLRLLYLRATARFIEPGIGSDSHFYLQWALDIIRGQGAGGRAMYAFPLYPLFLSIVYVFAEGDIFGVILLHMLLGAVNCGLIYLLAKRTFNQGSAFFAGLLGCFYSLFVFYDRMLLPTSLALFFALLSALMVSEFKDRPSPGRWFGLGMVLSLGILTRSSFMVLALVMALWVLFSYRGLSWKSSTVYSLCLIVPCLFVLGVLALRNQVILGDKMIAPAHGGINFYVGNNPRANGLFNVPDKMRSTQGGLIEDAHIFAEQATGRHLKASQSSKFWYRQSLNFMRSDPLRYGRLLLRKIALFWNGQDYVDDIEYHIFKEYAQRDNLPLLNYSFILPLALAGMVICWPQRKKAMFLYIFILSMMCAPILFFVNARYRLPAVPFLIVFASAFLWQLLESIGKRRLRSTAASLALLVGFSLLVNIDIATAQSSYNVTLHYNKGILLTEDGDIGGAIKEFETALKTDPEDFMSYFGIANAYYKLGKMDKAIAAFEKTIQISPYYYEAYFNIGIIYEERGLDKEAETAFKKVVAIRPDDAAAHYNLGRIYQKRGDYALALEEFSSALKDKPGHPDILEAIAQIEHKESK